MTLIFEKTKAVPYETTGGLDTVAVRMPSHEGARQLIESAGVRWRHRVQIRQADQARRRQNM